jgi:methionyl-tRNA formyltransferase
MRLALFADGPVGAAVFDLLWASYAGDIVALVVAGENELADRARAQGCHVLRHGVHTYDRLREINADVPIDLGLLAWWPHLLRSPLLQLPRLGFLNTHPSLLPHNRGKHSNFWALVEQVPFGVTVHWVNAGIDAGDIVAQRAIAYDWTDTGASLHTLAVGAMVQLVADGYPRWRTFDIPRSAQSATQGSYHHSRELEPASRVALDEPTTARDLLNRLRARTFPGFPACQFTDDGDTFEVRVQITRITQATHCP